MRGAEPFDCLTGEEEAAFILAETSRRGIPLTHLAPNLGVEKHVDYRHPAGIEGLEARVRATMMIVKPPVAHPYPLRSSSST